MRTGFRDPQYTHVILVKKHTAKLDGNRRQPHGVKFEERWTVFDYCRSKEAAEELVRIVNKPGSDRMIIEHGALAATLMLLNGD
jgi:hypothetical protein